MDLQASKMKKEKKEKPAGGGDSRKGKDTNIPTRKKSNPLGYKTILIGIGLYFGRRKKSIIGNIVGHLKDAFSAFTPSDRHSFRFFFKNICLWNLNK